MDDFTLTPAERSLLSALRRHEVRFLLVGLGAAVIEGAPVTHRISTAGSSAPVMTRYARQRQTPGASGCQASGCSRLDSAVSKGLERIDVVLTAHGLETFDVEYARALDRKIDGVAVRVLPLERVIASQRATNRPKDIAALPALEATLLARRET